MACAMVGRYDDGKLMHQYIIHKGKLMDAWIENGDTYIQMRFITSGIIYVTLRAIMIASR